MVLPFVLFLLPSGSTGWKNGAMWVSLINYKLELSICFGFIRLQGLSVLAVVLKYLLSFNFTAWFNTSVWYILSLETCAALLPGTALCVLLLFHHSELGTTWPFLSCCSGYCYSNSCCLLSCLQTEKNFSSFWASPATLLVRNARPLGIQVGESTS